MADPYISQISSFGFGIVPKGWLQCNGQLLAINTNQALFSLLGTTYGGNGSTTFALPNLQSLMPVGAGTNYTLGTRAGEASHTLLVTEMPAHNHPAAASSSSTVTASASGNYPAAPAAASLYATSANTTIDSGSTATGSNQPHVNQQPFLAINYCIAIQGIFPSRS